MGEAIGEMNQTNPGSRWSPKSGSDYLLIALPCENCGYNLLFIAIDLGIMERDRMSLNQPWVTDADRAVKYSLDVDIPGIWLSGEPFDMLKSRME